MKYTLEVFLNKLVPYLSVVPKSFSSLFAVLIGPTLGVIDKSRFKKKHDITQALILLLQLVINDSS